MKIISAVMTVVVGVVLLGSLLVPTISDATKTEETFDNTPYAFYQMKVLEPGDIWTFSDSVWSYNGDAIATSGNSSVSVIATDNTVIRQDGILRGTTYGNNLTSSAEVQVVDDASKLLVNSTASVYYDTGFGAVPDDGEYVLKTYEDSAYVHKDTTLWVTGYTALSASASQVMVHIEGSIEDGLTVSVVPKFGGTTTDIVVGNYVLDYEEVEGYVDLYKINNVKFDVTGTFDGESITKEFTYSTFVIPKTVTSELSVHLTSAQIAIMAVIPILVICAILMVAVGAFRARND